MSPNANLTARRRLHLLAFALALTAGAAPAAYATWVDGNMLTYSEDSWGGVPSPTAATTLLINDMSTLYSGEFGALIVGLTTGGYSMVFATSGDVLNYIPAGGLPGPLDANLLNPTLSSSGAFGGDVVTLKLNVDFSNAGLISGTSGYSLGSLVLTGFGTPDTANGIPALPDLDGLTVAQLLGISNVLLGGGSDTFGYSIGDIDTVDIKINNSFLGGFPSDFALEHLLPPNNGGTTSVPEPPSLALIAVGLLGLLLGRPSVAFSLKRRLAATLSPRSF